MITREIAPQLESLFRQYPIVTVTGPRQSGKTTLCRSVFPDLDYVNLEALDNREFAQSDPRGFLAQFTWGAVIDEIQHVPELLSYIQVLTDERSVNGQFVLTGSEQFPLSKAVSQSLAGRTALLRLLPFSTSERERAGASENVDDVLFSGFYPRIVDQGLNPRQALESYFNTYVERDVQRLGGIRDLSSFRRFVRLCAGRIGQLVNISNLGRDAGLSRQTVNQWLSVLEASYVLFQLQPFHANLRKRLVKSPKMYFYDVGLVSYLIGIEHSQQVATHPLRGNLFENAVVAEAMKYRYNRGLTPDLSFFRDSNGLECDILYGTGDGLTAIEAKAGYTVSSDHLKALRKVSDLLPRVSSKVLVYGGSDRQSRSDCEIVPLRDFSSVLERLDFIQEAKSFVWTDTGIDEKLSDIEKLDAAYRSQILPILRELPRGLAQPNGPFIVFEERSNILFINPTTYSEEGITASASHLLDPKNWQDTKKRHVISRGFDLNDADRRLNLEYRVDFKGREGARVDVSVNWRFGAEELVRTVRVRKEPIPGLEASVPYAALTSAKTGADEMIAKVGRQILLTL